jgi:CBS domain-containing protein
MATAGSVDTLVVRDVMTPVPESLHATHSVRAAIRIFATKHFEHLPVVSGQRLIGVISNLDVHAFAAQRPGALDIELAAMMTKNPIVVFPDTPLLDAAKLLIDRPIHCLPVVDQTRVLVGIVTPTDVLRTFVERCVVAPQDELAPAQIE